MANQAIGYAGEVSGIALSGLMETFLLDDSPPADPSKSLFGKVALGIAGAHPSPKTYAGQTAKVLNPKSALTQGAQQAKLMPAVHIQNQTIHNHTGDHQETYKAMQQSLAAATDGTGGGSYGHG